MPGGSKSRNISGQDGFREKASRPPAATSVRKPHYHGHRERMRLKFARSGASAMAEYEILEMLLYRSVRQGDTKPIAKRLIDEFGSLSEVLSAPVARLRGVKGIGEAGTIGATPTIANAVMDAVAHLGIRNLDMPLTAEKLWWAIQEATSQAG